MIKKIAFLVFVLQISACGSLQDIANTVLTDQPLTSQQIGRGLKEALQIGIGNGSEALSQVNGYLNSPYKILLPAEVRKVTDRLQNIPGFRQVESEMVKLLNRAAEDAAQAAKPIFVNAIKQMTFQDAMGILMGEKNAATSYLHKVTYNQLYDTFQPKVVKSLDRVNATKYWRDAVTAYNKIPLLENVNPELDDYVTGMALKGLFGMVEKEEREIRANVSRRTTDLLRKVFAKQDNT